MEPEITPQVEGKSDEISGIIRQKKQEKLLNEQLIEESEECLNISNSMAKTFNTSEDDHQLSMNKTLVSHATHAFQIGELPGDDNCLCSCVIHLFDRSETINIKSLRTRVINHIRNSKIINEISLIQNTGCQTREEYCEKIKKGIIWAGECERHALAELYPSILFCIISKRNNNTNEPLVYTDVYVKDISSYKKCIIIFYDDEAKYYVPLFLYDKINRQEANIRLKYDDVTKSLLVKFIEDTLDYHGYMNFEIGDGFGKNELHYPKEDESADVNEKIADNTSTNLLPISESRNNEKFEGISSLKTPSYGFKANKKFYQKKVAGDGHCLYLSLCFLLSNICRIIVKDLREQVADSILQSKNVDDAVLFSETRKTREQYFNEIRNTNAWGGELEIRAIAEIHKIIIRIVYPTAVKSVITDVNVTEIPENESSFEKCVHIVHENGNHYEPLYLSDENDSKKKITIFDRNDETVKGILREFIKTKYNYTGPIQFGDKTYEDEVALKNYVEEKPLYAPNLIRKDEKEIPMRKRKRSDNHENSPVTYTTNQLPSSISDTHEVVGTQSLTSSRSLPPNDYINTPHRGNEPSGSIEQLLQTDIRTLNVPVAPRRATQDSILSKKTTVPCNTQNEHMRFEVELTPGFRGRLLTQYIPKKKNRNNGTKSELKKPNYFANAQNQKYLNLLIPETFLAADLNRMVLEITIITPNINGRIHIHPYFVFYDLRSTRKSPTVNPLFINLGYDELHKVTEHSEGIRNLLLYLPVVMLKHDELLRNQPIKPYPLSNSNDQDNLKKYTHYDAFIRDFHLNDLQFAVNLCEIVGNKLQRLIQYEYISGISTQDKEYKVKTSSDS